MIQILQAMIPQLPTPGRNLGPIAARLAVSALIAPMLGVLGGCGTAVVIDARNDASQTAVLLIEQDVAFEDDRVLARARLTPGETRAIGTFDVGWDTVTARIVESGDEAIPTPKARLSRGYSRLIIEEGGSQSWSPWTIRVER